jgi:hypothetical protein
MANEEREKWNETVNAINRNNQAGQTNPFKTSQGIVMVASKNNF